VSVSVLGVRVRLLAHVFLSLSLSLSLTHSLSLSLCLSLSRVRVCGCVCMRVGEGGGILTVALATGGARGFVEARNPCSRRRENPIPEIDYTARSRHTLYTRFAFVRSRRTPEINAAASALLRFWRTTRETGREDREAARNLNRIDRNQSLVG